MTEIESYGKDLCETRQERQAKGAWESAPATHVTATDRQSASLRRERASHVSRDTGAQWRCEGGRWGTLSDTGPYRFSLWGDGAWGADSREQLGKGDGSCLKDTDTYLLSDASLLLPVLSNHSLYKLSVSERMNSEDTTYFVMIYFQFSKLVTWFIYLEIDSKICLIFFRSVQEFTRKSVFLWFLFFFL